MSDHTTAARPGRARMLAWVLYDWAHNAFGTIVQTFVFAPYFTRRIAPSEEWGVTCWGNAIGVAGLCVAVTGPVLGAIADQGGRRKPWIGAFTALCIAATAALCVVRPGQAFLWPALALVVLGTLGSDFALPMFLFTPDRAPARASLRRRARDGLGQLRDSLRSLRRYLGILRFLLARMLYVDGLATTFSMGGVFAAGLFGMTEQQVLLFGITLNVTAGTGNQRLGMSTIIVLFAAGLALVPTLPRAARQASR